MNLLNHESPSRAWVEVDLEAIAHNLDIARQALPETELMPVIKAGAYGHGLEPVARRLDSHGISFFGVANAGEARRLSRAGVRTKPFILGPTFPEEREEIVLNNWCCTISTVPCMIRLSWCMWRWIPGWGVKDSCRSSWLIWCRR